MKLAERVFSIRPVTADFPTTAQLLVSGGDARIALDPHSGLNKYGCQPCPDAGLLAFGSSTASVVSPAGFAAAKQLRQRLLQAAEAGEIESVSGREIRRIRQELLESFGLSDAGIALVFASSGTDAHALIARSVADSDSRPLTIVMVEESETGSGVAAALQVNNAKVLSVALRLADGMPRALTEIDAEVGAKVAAAVSSGARVLLVMVDQSKTGLIAPGLDCIAELYQRHAGQLDVLVDACQLRLAPSALQGYLRRGFMLAVTGSKFLAGPSFSAALLLPEQLTQRLKLLQFDKSAAVNPGLLLRWEAALAELRRFRAVPPALLASIMQAFALAVTDRLNHDPCFASLPVHPLARPEDTQRWDGIQSIFPFLLYRTDSADGRVPLSREQTLKIYRRLQADVTPASAVRYQLGQPVACGSREGIAVSALRLCLSARLISDAFEGKEISSVIAEAMAALDKVAELIASLR